jgi:flagellar hook-associated protein 1 FlgK
MSVTFSLFNIGSGALRANQFGLTVTGNNIANVNTPGFTRQEAAFSPSDPQTQGVLPKLSVGQGVTVAGVRAARDQFVEARLNVEAGVSGRLTAKRGALLPVEAALNPTEGGVGKALTDFFGAFRSLESQPTSFPLRQSVVQRATQLGAEFRSTVGRLEQIRTETDASLRASVVEANGITARIAALNTEIQIQESVGASPSELIDQRTEAARRLSELTGARVAVNQDGTVAASLADGRPLVLGGASFALEITSAPPAGLASVTLGGQPVEFASGGVRGAFDAIAFTEREIANLNALAVSVADRVNGLHAGGADLSGAAGGAFFTSSDGGPLSAANLVVNPTVRADLRRIAAAAPGAGTGDGSNARAIANLLTDQTSVVGDRTGTFSSIFGSFVQDAGDAVKSAETDIAAQQLVLSQLESQRNAVSGVSIDEEAVNLLRFQRGFEAAARFLRVADEVTQTILSLAQ